MKLGIVSTAVMLAASNLPAVRVFAADLSQPAPCAAPAYRQFDFWAGDWDVFDVGGTIKVAHAQVDLILSGCVLREDYQGSDGHKGQSFTIYHAARNVWHQTWVTNRGELLEIEGKLDAGVMILSGEDHAKHTLVRGWWKPVNGEVRETAATSRDDGKTWKPWFDLVFRPATSATSPTPVAEDKKTIAAIDTQYQLAVKENDAATMDRILADDFILVTGSGKTYSKADLLAQARSGRVHYERQDDTNQTVRTWADTAVITALLTEKGTDEGKPLEKTVWFSDTYLRTPSGWRYVFGQSSLPLFKAPQ
ncbi:MAG TPA: nuclear transport factor 2 family protein [Candidatus Sulfotelmatobacter sp.]